MVGIYESTFFEKFIKNKYSLLIISIITIGFCASITAVLFRSGVHNLEIVRLALLDRYKPIYILPILGMVGGCISGLVISCFQPASSGSGISHLIGFLHGRKIPLNLRVAITKLIGGIIAIGSGFPLGAEGPSVQMGSSIAWQLSKWFKTPKVFTKLLVSAGGGAGLAAVFGAPIAGVVFILEELFRTSKPIIILFFAVTSFVADSFGAILNSLGLDNESIRFSSTNGFMIDPHHVPLIKFFPVDIIYLIILGVFIALIGEIYVRYLITLQLKSGKIFKNNYVLKMTICGAIIGIIYSILPEIFHEFTELDNLIIDGRASSLLGFQTFIVIFLTTGIAVSAGAPGGLFMPMITLGASIGLAFYGLSDLVIGYAPSSLIFAGIGGFISACSRTPITAIFIVLALTHNNLLLNPVLVCCAVAYVASKFLNSHSIYERQLENKLMGEEQ